MRPVGDISQALWLALQRYGQRGATLREVAADARVSVEVARNTLKNNRRDGRICIVGTRCVPGRNRPALVYALAQGANGKPQTAAANDDGYAVLSKFWG